MASIEAASSRLTRTPLRGLDWRFVLPRPPHGAYEYMIVVGGSAELAADAQALGLAAEVGCELPAAPTADAIVVLHGAHVDPRQVATSLREGGVLYWEVDRRTRRTWLMTPQRMSRSLRVVGLRSTAMYWAKPDFTHCEMYLPLDHRYALRWYITTLFMALTPQRWLLEQVVRMIAHVQKPHFATFVPCYVLIATNGHPPAHYPASLPRAALPAALQDADVRTLILTSGIHERNRVVALPFRSDDRHPQLVCKTMRLPNFNHHLSAEQAAIDQIRSCIDHALRATIPQPLGMFKQGESLFSLENYVAGTSLSRSSSGYGVPLNRRITDVRLATEWLAAFHSQAQTGSIPWNDAAIHEWIEKPLHAYQIAFGLSRAEERLFAGVRQYAYILRGTIFPLVWQHHNYGTWNICRQNQQIGVIDWEHARPGPALYDLIHFVTHWYATVHQLHSPRAQLKGFHKLFCTPGRGDASVQAVHAMLAEYVQRLHMDQRSIPLLLVLTWVEKALSYLDGQQTLGKHSSDARAGNQAAQYVGVLAQAADQLFIDPSSAIRTDPFFIDPSNAVGVDTHARSVK